MFAMEGLPVASGASTPFGENRFQFPNSPTAVEKERLERVFEARGRSSSRPKVHLRARSLSPVGTVSVRDLVDDVAIMSHSCFEKVTLRMETRLEKFLDNIAADSDFSSKVANAPLTDRAKRILADARHNVLTTAKFQEDTKFLGKLAKQNIEAESAKRIQELLLIISHPARLLECLEFDHERFHADADHSRRLVEMRSDNLHLPRCIVDLCARAAQLLPSPRCIF